ncbi:transcription factor E2F8 [Phyllopteryx taeniolatus]|uniref:transcription factor E2F8 n=1 Tax=Phyllopteryx taeniolatus TaxID=161469 RepID=UPI002AD2CE57|nr:transcription factor E2F8 [Phyllopteryx taeniolatus]
MVLLSPWKPRRKYTQFIMGPLTTPKKAGQARSVDPWTPTSNLKMLISAASPEIRNREKQLCPHPELHEVLDPTQDVEHGDESEKMISRKEKSLGLLCHKFLARCPDWPDPAANNEICLDDVATDLNVERRRIYDIMNVLESLHMVSRSAKNRYTWHGQTNLAQTLAILKQVGGEQRYGQQMQQIRQSFLDKEFDSDGEEKENHKLMENSEHRQRELFFVELPGVEFKAASVNSRKDKSLRVMSQKFVMLFLVSNPPVVSLDVAAKILIGEDQGADQDKSKFKTKVRRLYDIANVLRSLKLIEKVHVTEERGKKPAFEWVGPIELPQVKDVPSGSSLCPPNKTKVLESRSYVENCAKNLFSSPPGAKRSFTRHPSLMKLAKSIQDDRRKISSAPSSPAKGALAVSVFPSKMAQLAAICKIQLDQESAYFCSSTRSKALKAIPAEANTMVAKLQSTTSSSVKPPQSSCQAPNEENGANPNVHSTPLASQPSGSVAYIPANFSPLIPVILPQQPGAGPYAVYLHPSSLRPNPLARPQPTSSAVRSMTFEEKTGSSPTAPLAANSRPTLRVPDRSPLLVKRLYSDSAPESTPPKAKRTNSNLQGAAPKQWHMLDVPLKTLGSRQLSSCPSPRALHLDAEFINTPGSAMVAQTLEQSLETFLDKDEKAVTSDWEAGLTSVRSALVTPGHINTETFVPTGYLIPLSQQSVVTYKENQGSAGERNKPSTPVYIYQTPTAGSRAPPVQEVTPTSIRLHGPAAAASPHLTPQAQRLHGPSPAIVNFTLQNLGLISGSSTGNTFASPQTSERSNTVLSPLALQQRGMVFIKPMTVQQSPHPVALISIQQPLVTNPKGTALPQHSFFHTPVPLSPMASAMVSPSGQAGPKTVYIPQRKLDVNTEEML